MSELRLLYVIDSLAPGGAETSLAEMAPGLVARGLELHVLPLRPLLDLAPSLVSGGAVVHTPSRRLGRMANVRTVMNRIQLIRPDLVHSTLYESDIAGRVAAWLTRVPVSTSVVGDSYGHARRGEVDHGRLRLALAADRLTAQHASRFHAVSESLARSITLNLGIPRGRIDVVPRGRDPEKYRFRPAGVRRNVRNALGLSPDAPVILTVGRLEPAKGLLSLMRALPFVTAAHPDLVVLMAGKHGESSRELRLAATRLGIDVRFLGHRTDVPALLAAADVLCFPSLREGSPGTLIEAMAVGCPVVASDIAANEEVLGRGDGCAGQMFRTGDHRHLGAALLRVLMHPDSSGDVARLGRARYEDLYTIDIVARSMNEFFRSAAATRPISKMSPRQRRDELGLHQ